MVKFLQRVLGRLVRRRRRPLAIPVDRPPDPKTLDDLGRERLYTHVRTRADIH